MTRKDLQEMSVGQVIDTTLFHRELEVLMTAYKRAYKYNKHRTPYHYIVEIGAWDVDIFCEMYKAVFGKSTSLPKRVRDFVNQLGRVAYIKTYKQLEARCKDDN